MEQMDSILLVALLRRRRRKKKTKRSMWMHEIICRGIQQGEYHNLLQRMRVSDRESHFKYLRISKESFDSLLSKVYTIVIIILNL